MIQLNKLCLISFAFIAFLIPNSFAQTLAQWNFDVNTTATTIPANATVSTAAWSLGTMSYPAGRTGGTIDNSLSTTGFNAAIINPNKYLQFTITPNANYAMVLNAISFYDQKSGTGPTSWVMRSSLDTYASDLNSPSPTATQTPFSTTPNTVSLGINFQNISTPVTFRIYAYGASGSTGTWRVDDLTIEGNLFDITSPVISASKSTISFSTILTGAPSVATSFVAAGFGLTSNLTVAAPTGYEISLSESSGYTTSLAFSPISGVVSSKLIYVRMTGVSPGFFNGNISLTSTGIPTKTIATAGSTINQPMRSSIASVRSRSNNTNVFTGGRVTAASEFGPNQIFMQDVTGGISIYNSAKNIASEYALQLGDSVEIFGYKSNFNGLDQITMLSLTKIGTPQYNPPPVVINASEMAAHEGELVTIQNVAFPGTGEVYKANTNYAFGFTPVRILSTNGSNTIVGTTAVSATGNITGISGVYGAAVQLYPRFTADLNPTGAGITDATFQDNNNLDVVTWNLEWFGSPTLGPSNNALQATNVSTTLSTMKADIYQVEEVSDSVGFKNLVAALGGYSCTCSPEYSYSNVDADPYGQRLCFVYKTALFSNVVATPLLTNFKNDPSLLTDYPNTITRFWASGRLPYLMTATVTINNMPKNMGFVAIHGRANTSASPAQEIYDMRKYDVEKLKTFLDANYPNLPFIMSGDFNDDLDETVAYVATNTTTFDAYVNDGVNYNLFTRALSLASAKSTAGFTDMIDHIIGSNEMNNTFVTARVGTPQTYITSYTSTTTDHYPVMAKFNLSSLPIPVELLNFTGQFIDKQTVRLDWATSSELNSDYFSIEKSGNGKDYQSIGKVKAAGSSSHKIGYSFDDNSVTKNDKISYYRLKQVDENGSFKYSKTIAVYQESGKNNPIKVYPNPAKNTIFVETNDVIKSINIYNLQGILVAHSTTNTLNISDFPTGIYVLEVENTEGSLSRSKFVKE
jgi:hypothetical protein